MLGKVKRFFKNILATKVSKDGPVYKLYRWASAKKYQIFVEKKYSIKKIISNNKKTNKALTKLISQLKSNKYKEYLVVYNPEWMGVANSTIGLFDVNAPLMPLTQETEIEKLANAIAKSKLEKLIFSQICDGWIPLLNRVHELNPNIKMAVLWHANNYESSSEFTWGLNKQVIELYRDGKITAIAFVKESMYQFYKQLGYNTYFLTNNVKSKDFVKFVEYGAKKREALTCAQKDENAQFGWKNVRVGVYNSFSRQIKNVATQILATKCFDNSFVDIVPSKETIDKYAKTINVDYASIDEMVPTQKLLERMSQNDINLYVTFTECSPMLPLESFESGVPCLIGNNNDYFKGGKLREYVCVDKEDDPIVIAKKMQNVLDNKDEVMTLYRQWKKEFDKEMKEKVQEFISIV